MKEFVEAGRIVNTHGVNGEVKIEVWLDSPALFRKIRRLYLDGTEKKILSSRVHKSFLIAGLEGIDDLNAAMALKGRRVEVLRADMPLKKGEFLVQDLIGFTVVDEDGAVVGTMTGAEETPAAMLYIVKGEREHLIPAVPAFLRGIDEEKRQIRVHMIEGL